MTPDQAFLQWRILNVFGSELPAEELRQALADTAGLMLVSPGGSKKHGYMALLKVKPPGFRGFVDQANAGVSIPGEIWSEAVSLCLQGGWPGQPKAQYEKFTIAAWMQHSSRALASFSFGRLLHMVSYLIGSKSVFGKREGQLVPYPLSEEFEKQENARLMRPTSLRAGECCVASWPEFQQLLATLLTEGSGTMAVSDMKRTFRARFHLELSETALGHTSMTGLLSDARFGAVFVQELLPDTKIRLRRPEE